MLVRKDIILIKNNQFPEGIMLDCTKNKLDTDFITAHSANTKEEIDRFAGKNNTLCFRLIYQGTVIFFAGVELKNANEADLKLVACDRKKINDESLVDFLAVFSKKIMKPELKWTFSCDQIKRPDYSIHRFFESEQTLQEVYLAAADKFKQEFYCVPTARL